MLRRLLITAVVAAGLLFVPARAQTAARVPLVLISLDGWRWDYHTRTSLPNLRSLIARGVRADGLIPSFPTKTFPNHYTLVTGLYPGHHGIVSNTIWDPETRRTFNMDTRAEVADPMWWGGEPLWNTVRKALGKAATYFWPGSEAPIGGSQADYWVPYDKSVPNDERVDQVLRWLDLPAAERPTLLTLYFSDVDTAGHSYGPNSPELGTSLGRVDSALGRLLHGLERRGLVESVNIVVTSDHGMAETSRQRVIVVDDLVPPSDGFIVDLDPTLGVWPHPGREDALYQRLVKAHPRLHVFRRAETPESWHYRDHPRIPPIVGVVDEGWSLMRQQRLVDAFSRTRRGIGGSHGFDPKVKSMRGVFIAAGPSFKRNTTIAAFENVEVYQVLCAALGLTPAPNDGDPAFGKTVLAAVTASHTSKAPQP